MSRGGSRSGAGRRGWRRKIEHCLRLDMRQLSRSGLLDIGRQFAWRWTNSCTGETTGSVGVEVRTDGLMLNYRNSEEPVTVHIAVVGTPCNFGGSRRWFICSTCQKKCLVLAYFRSRWACRACHNLAYVSESLDSTSRSWRRQGRLESILEENWERPKGMWRRTHERLLEQISAIIDAREAGFVVSWARFLKID